MSSHPSSGRIGCRFDLALRMPNFLLSYPFFLKLFCIGPDSQIVGFRAFFVIPWHS